MKIKISQETFAKALLTASRFVSPKAQLPVLGNIYLSADKAKLQIASTNLEISSAISLACDVSKDGEITVPGRVITEIVSNLPSGNLTLEAEKEQLKISTETFESTISGMNPADFPKVPTLIGKQGRLSLSKDLFLQAISQVSFAVSIDETRPILTGVLFIFQKDSLVLVATDGFRLSQKKIKITSPPNGGKIIIPKSAILELTRFSAEEEEITMNFNQQENQVLFGIDNAVLSSRILEGEFPDFEKIIPKETGTQVFLDKEEFLRAIKLASVFAREAANIVKINIGKSFLDISAESQTSGNQTTRVDAKVEGGEKLEIAFNYRFLEEFLHAVKGEEIKIELSGPSSPGKFIDTSDPDFLHLIMPVRVQG